MVNAINAVNKMVDLGEIWIYDLSALLWCIPKLFIHRVSQVSVLRFFYFLCFVSSPHSTEKKISVASQEGGTWEGWACWVGHCLPRPCSSPVRHSCPKAKLTKSRPTPFPKGQIPTNAHAKHTCPDAGSPLPLQPFGHGGSQQHLCR